MQQYTQEAVLFRCEFSRFQGTLRYKFEIPNFLQNQ